MSKKIAQNNLGMIAWTTGVLVFTLAVVAWGQSYSWYFEELGIYQIFPLLGLLAFSLMWTHYSLGFVRKYLDADRKSLKLYFETTSTVVLFAILLHPGLLVYALWRDGLGLPPGSTQSFVGMSAYWAIVIATIALLAFLAFELRRFYGKKPWWKYVLYANDVAMFLIFIHALKLGGALRLGWYKGVWYFYGVTLAIALYQKYIIKRRSS